MILFDPRLRICYPANFIDARVSQFRDLQLAFRHLRLPSLKGKRDAGGTTGVDNLSERPTLKNIKVRFSGYFSIRQ